jgi:NodT family efflux transporter outer membrane factor (OMF) lipoprotein
LVVGDLGTDWESVVKMQAKGRESGGLVILSEAKDLCSCLSSDAPRRTAEILRFAQNDRPTLLVPVFLALLFSAACSIGPKYARPPVETPAAYKELPPSAGGPQGEWKLSQPQEQSLRGKWWEVFDDPQLNALEERIEVSNQNLKVAEAQYRQARDLIGISRAGLFPTVNAGPSMTVEQTSKNAPQPAGNAGQTLGDLVLPFQLTYELDAWGRIHRAVEAARENAQASAADLETARLSIHAELASDYFSLRGLDAQKHLLDSTVIAYQKALELTQNRYIGGLAARAEVAQAETQLETTQAQDIDVGVTRAQFEHALAALVGQPASTFSIPASPLNLSPPKIPVGVPSELLERRADIAAAERRTAAANAQIGFAKSAYYPTLTLSAAGGTEGSTIGNWVAWPSRFFALGPTLLETLYDAGLRHATTDQARAAYEANVAAYRQSVLTAFQEVEDNLAALRILEEESAKQQQAVESAERSTALSLNRYKGGLVTYFEVITAQSIALSDEVTAVNILTRRMNSSVLLIKALGGGWNASSLPSFASKAPSQVPAMRSDDAGRR